VCVGRTIAMIEDWKKKEEEVELHIEYYSIERWER
jgi:hypothetical protein